MDKPNIWIRKHANSFWVTIQRADLSATMSRFLQCVRSRLKICFRKDFLDWTGAFENGLSGGKRIFCALLRWWFFLEILIILRFFFLNNKINKIKYNKSKISPRNTINDEMYFFLYKIMVFDEVCSSMWYIFLSCIWGEF